MSTGSILQFSLSLSLSLSLSSPSLSLFVFIPTACIDPSLSSSSSWFGRLEASGWFGHVTRLLKAARTVLIALHQDSEYGGMVVENPHRLKVLAQCTLTLFFVTVSNTVAYHILSCHFSRSEIKYMCMLIPFPRSQQCCGTWIW